MVYIFLKVGQNLSANNNILFVSIIVSDIFRTLARYSDSLSSLLTELTKKKQEVSLEKGKHLL